MVFTSSLAMIANTRLEGVKSENLCGVSYSSESNSVSILISTDKKTSKLIQLKIAFTAPDNVFEVVNTEQFSVR